MFVRLFLLLVAALMLSWFLPKELSGGAINAAGRSLPPSKENGLLSVVATVALEPITGPPQSVSLRIAHLLDEASQREQLALFNYEGAKGDYQLQGDLQIVQEENSVKLVYTWLVFDQTGEFVSSTSGTEIVKSAGVEPWSEVPEATLKVIAEQGIAAVAREVARSKPWTSQSR